MMPKRILVGHDGSKDVDDAFDSALDFAALCGARLQVVSGDAARGGDPRDAHYEEVFEAAAPGRTRRDSRPGSVGHAAEQILRWRPTPAT